MVVEWTVVGIFPSIFLESPATNSKHFLSPGNDYMKWVIRGVSK